MIVGTDYYQMPIHVPNSLINELDFVKDVIGNNNVMSRSRVIRRIQISNLSMASILYEGMLNFVQDIFEIHKVQSASLPLKSYKTVFDRY